MQPNLLTIRPRAAHILCFFGPARGHNLFYFWAGLLLTLLVLGTAPDSFGQTTTTSFTYNGSDGTDGSPQSFTVPTGVTQLTVVAWGAPSNGLPGRVDAVMSVTAGQVLNIYVGGSPNNGVRGPGSIQTGGFNGGGAASGLGNAGGGATDIRIGGNRVLVSGGSGGSGAGGSANGDFGGNGGGLTGGDGKGSDVGTSTGGVGGFGGTQSDGGDPGPIPPTSTTSNSGVKGSLGQGGTGGAGQPGSGGGGGGGGGYYGGGGGSTARYPTIPRFDSGGGGGGSSYTDPTLFTSVIHTQGAQGGPGTHGLLTLSYRTSSPSLTATISGNLSVCSGQPTSLTALASNGTAPYSYTWAASAGITLSGGSTSVVQATAGAGVSGIRTLTVTVQDATGPTSRTTVTASLTVTNVSVSITPTPSSTVTPGSAVTLTASGATSYTWSDNSIINPLILSSVTSNTTVSVTGVTGACSNTASVTVFAITLPDAPTLSASTSVVCEGTTVTVTGSTTNTVTGYQWYKDGPSGVPVSLGAAQQTATLTLSGALPSQSGNYSLVVSNGVGSATSAAFSLTVNPQPTVTLLFGGATQSMMGPSLPLITLTSPLDPNNLPFFQVFGGVYYERLGWIECVNGYQIKCNEPSSTGVFKIKQLGPYTITVTGANGCSRTVQGVIESR